MVSATSYAELGDPEAAAALLQTFIHEVIDPNARAVGQLGVP
jgi:hypothetical protein